MNSSRPARLDGLNLPRRRLKLAGYVPASIFTRLCHGRTGRNASGGIGHWMRNSRQTASDESGVTMDSRSPAPDERQGTDTVATPVANGETRSPSGVESLALILPSVLPDPSDKRGGPWSGFSRTSPLQGFLQGVAA